MWDNNRLWNGTGFFCKIKYLNKEIYCLITNDHVITKFILLNKEYIKIRLNNEIKKISLDLYRRIWNDEELDFTCIEIIEEDNIINKIIPFEIDDNCYIKNNDNNEYDKKKYHNSVGWYVKRNRNTTGYNILCKK